MIKFFNYLFPSFVAINSLIDLVDAKIISHEGFNVLNNPEKMKIVNEAIKNNKNGIILVNFEDL